ESPSPLPSRGEEEPRSGEGEGESGEHALPLSPEGEREIQPALRLGLRQIEGLQREAAERLVARRPYRTVEELRSRGSVPVHAIQRLAAADAFRSIGLDRRAALWD